MPDAVAPSELLVLLRDGRTVTCTRLVDELVHVDTFALVMRDGSRVVVAAADVAGTFPEQQRRT